MRIIRISETVWKEITRWGKSGETPDDILRRLLNIENKVGKKRGPRPRYNTRKMTAKLFKDDHLYISFRNGPSESFLLPARRDRDSIRKLRGRAIAFAEEYGASLKQVNTIEKTLTEAGYYLEEPHPCHCP
jgi:negative regulator of replication initiation